MKHLFCISIFTLLFSYASANTTHVVSDSVSQQIQQEQNINTANETKDINILTLAVNRVNNVMTYAGVLVGVLTILVALYGFLGHKLTEKNIKTVLDEEQRRVSTKISELNTLIQEINNKKQELNNCITLTKKIDGKVEAQEKYMCNSNQYLYESVEKIVNQINDTTIAKAIYTDLMHSYHITNLYSTESAITENTTKFAALAYLQANGTRIDIEHLEYISNFDSDETHKKWAREIIGIIKHKYAE